jgi:hypothetical protein
MIAQQLDLALLEIDETHGRIVAGGDSCPSARDTRDTGHWALVPGKAFGRRTRGRLRLQHVVQNVGSRIIDPHVDLLT